MHEWYQIWSWSTRWISSSIWEKTSEYIQINFLKEAFKFVCSSPWKKWVNQYWAYDYLKHSTRSWKSPPKCNWKWKQWKPKKLTLRNQNWRIKLGRTQTRNCAWRIRGNLIEWTGGHCYPQTQQKVYENTMQPQLPHNLLKKMDGYTPRMSDLQATHPFAIRRLIQKSMDFFN